MKNRIEKDLEMQKRATRLIPGMTQLLSKRPDMFTLGVWPGYFSKAKGVEVWDLDGNRFIDMSIGGIGANVLGYCDPDVDRAVMRAIKKGTSCSLNCPEEVELADVLCQLHSWADMARFARTGGEAMAVAVRIARAHTKREKIAFCGYHGWHDWYLAANLGTKNALGDHLLPGLKPNGVPKSLAGTALPFKYNCLDELETIVRNHGNDLAAVIMEPIRNIEPDNGFLEGVKSLAKRAGSILIFDEISSGFRLCPGGAHLKIGIEPQMAVFAKALGNGYPIAAIIGEEAVMQSAQKTFISSTYWTDRIGPAASLAVIEKYTKESVHSHLSEIGKMVRKGWMDLAEKHNLDIEIAGLPACSHFTFKGKESLELKAYFIQLMIEKGFLSSSLFYVMYAHKKHHIEAYLDACNIAFYEISDAIEKKDVQERLMGKPSNPGFKRLN